MEGRPERRAAGRGRASIWCHGGSLKVAFLVLVAAGSCGAAAFATPVERVCPERLAVRVGDQELLLPYCSSRPLDVRDEGVTRAIVVLHASGRDAYSVYGAVKDAARRAGDAGRATVIVAPQFLIEEDVTAHHLAPDVLRWRPIAGGADWEQGWDQGNESGAESASTSSFSVLDFLLIRLSDPALFPHLERVVVAGISLGGQFVNRFAAGSRAEDRLREERGVRLRYLVGAPSSYLYFSPERPVKGSASAFAEPSAVARRACPGWNTYRYGLDGLNAYMAAVGAEGLRAQYAAREVVYLIGDQDRGGEKSCPALLQGEDRLERVRAYCRYLEHCFGPGIAERHVLALAKGLGHTDALFTSPCGLRWLFDLESSGGCLD